MYVGRRRRSGHDLARYRARGRRGGPHNVAPSNRLIPSPTYVRGLVNSTKQVPLGTFSMAVTIDGSELSGAKLGAASNYPWQRQQGWRKQATQLPF